MFVRVENIFYIQIKGENLSCKGREFFFLFLEVVDMIVYIYYYTRSRYKMGSIKREWLI